MRLTWLSLPVLGLLVLAAAAPQPAWADAQQTQNFAAWAVMTRCAEQAHKQFPDLTPEGNARREAARQECLRTNHLPVTATVPAPAPSH
jgi:hypothetical protein